MKRLLLLCAALAVAAPPAPAFAEVVAGGAPAVRSAEENALYALFDEEWAFRQAEFGAGLEDGQYADFLPQVDPASHQRRAAQWGRYLTRLETIDGSRLSDRARVDAAVFKSVLEGFLIEARARSWEMPFNSDSSFWSSLDEGETWSSVEAYRAYLARLRQLPRYFDQQMANMDAGLKRGFSVPKVTLAGRDKSIAAYVTEGAHDNPYYKPFLEMPAGIEPAQARALQAEAEEVITGQVIPSYRKLLDYFEKKYVPRARETLAASKMPDGTRYYRDQIRLYTTLDEDPEAVHQTGLREVAALEAQVRTVAQKAGLSGSVAEVFAALRADPRFTAKSPEDLLMRTAWIAKQVDGRIGGLIGTLPRKRFAIRAVPDEIAPFYTSGRGGLEACWMNTYNLPSRPLYALTALTLHECSPGHSLQTALADEQDARPKFRQTVYFSGYSEGWGLYSEWLGVEMGLYRTPEDELGRLSYAMWRACRLVIDTGIHHYGWSREKAVAYLKDRTGLSEHEIGTEVDRYISWPGQALSYKLGELEIRRIRADAEARLGSRFDPRQFHDAILSLGSVPLPVLRSEMAAWIEAQAKQDSAQLAG